MLNNINLNDNSMDLVESREKDFLTKPQAFKVTPDMLGSASFRRDYGLKYAYISGAMYKGIASKELVVAMGKAGLMGFLGTGGLSIEKIQAAIVYIQNELNNSQSYGMNLLHSPGMPELEMKTVALYLKHGVRFVEAAAYMQISPALLRFRLSGIRRNENGEIETLNRVIGKCSRPEVAEVFMRPAPEKMVQQLLTDGWITEEEASLAKEIPVAQDICVEADSGGHTDQGNAYVLMPAICSLRDRIMKEQVYALGHSIRVGAAGGIGAPEAVVAAFMMGADFIVTGSINQCTVEAGTSDAVKDILQDINVQDTEYAPAGDMFEMGAKVQVVKKGVFFPARANKLYDLYLRYNSIDEIDERTKTQIQDKYFKRSFEDVWTETKAHYSREQPDNVAALERSSKQKMALIFRWYFVHSTRLAMGGSDDQRVDYQIHCGPALGAFNQWVTGTELESWRNRHVDKIAEKLILSAASMLSKRINTLCSK